MGQYYHSFRENADLKLFVKSLLETIFGKLIVEREICLNHLESSQELQLIYSKAFSVSLPHIARTLYFRHTRGRGYFYCGQTTNVSRKDRQ